MGLALAAVAFVGTHIGLAVPSVRGRLVAMLGARGFMLVYALVAVATLVLMVRAYKAAPVEPLWVAPVGAWHGAVIVMWAAAVLFMGSMAPGNLALAGARGGARTGVLRITRHPMMWAFALWAAVHVALAGDLATVILGAAVATLALGGAAAQDVKKRALATPGWAEHVRATAFVPFGRGLAGPGWRAALLGTGLLLAATFAHPYAGAPPVPPWAWPV